MRSAVILIALAASPATAWEFSASPICTLSHAEAAANLSREAERLQELVGRFKL